jgi:hypothetical protein
MYVAVIVALGSKLATMRLIAHSDNPSLILDASLSSYNGRAQCTHLESPHNKENPN